LIYKKDQWIRVFDLQAMPEKLDLPIDNATSLRNQAKLLREPETKLGLLARASALSPSDQHVLLDTAFVLLDQREFRKALHAFEAAIDLMTTEPAIRLADALEGCAIASFRLGDREQAKQYLQRALQQLPGDTHLLERLEALQNGDQ
jgi:tetratricopeptide (TPR) repeat protein